MAGRGVGMRLRPLAIGDVLDETFNVYRRNFLGFVLAMAVAVVPMALLSLVVPLMLGIDPAFTNLDRMPVERIALFVALVLVLVLAWGVVYLLASLATIRIASNAILGEPVAVGEAYRHAASRSGATILASLVSGLVVGLLVMTCIGIPFAVYVGVGWSVVMPAIVIEHLSGMAALRRSWDLVRGHRWRLIVVYVVLGLISYLLVSLPGGVVSMATIPATLLAPDNVALMLGIQVVNALVGAAAQALFGGIGFITATVVYYDLRVRQEAFDLQQRAQAIGEPDAGERPVAPYRADAPGRPGGADDAHRPDVGYADDRPPRYRVEGEGGPPAPPDDPRTPR